MRLQQVASNLLCLDPQNLAVLAVEFMGEAKGQARTGHSGNRGSRQSTSNLLSNAVTSTPAGGRVDVLLRSAGSWVEFVVRDTGAGMSADFRFHPPRV